jgi:hypothetical protein
MAQIRRSARVYSFASPKFLILDRMQADVPSFIQEDNALGDSPNPSKGSATANSERRKAPRYTLIASTELTDDKNSMKLSGRIMEISRSGCYVDILNALPVGTLLTLQISCDQGTLKLKGKILYIHEGIGMGVMFVDPPEDQLKILDSWLAVLPPAHTT